MATYDMTSSSTTGVGADSVAILPGQNTHHFMYNVEAYLDINAGAEVMKAFNSSVTADIDFAAGDDIIDGADVTSTGFCAKGTNGQTNTVVGSAASTYTQFVTTTDTIDVLLAGAAPSTGRIRVYATLIDCNEAGAEASSAARDALA